MNPEEFLAEIGGVPFLDDATLKPNVLLTAVAVVRRSAEPQIFSSLGDYLDPENAKQVFDRHAKSKIEHVDWEDLSTAEASEVANASRLVVESMPQWRPLFEMPKRYRRMATSTSSTSVLVPQTIYLGPRAFRDEETLRETLIHEHSHVWLNFIAEVFDLQVPEAPNDYVLPSGTAGKTYRGVMFAAHFAASAALALSQRRAQGENHVEERLQYLTQYLDGCLSTMEKRPYGSAVGNLVTNVMAQRRDELTKESSDTAEAR